MFDVGARVDDLRRRLDAVDDRIISELAARFKLIDELAAVKQDANLPVRDADREQELLERVTARAVEQGIGPGLVQELFRHVLEHSVDQQHWKGTPTSDPATVTVSYQGVRGSYSQLAASRHFAARQASLVLSGRTSFSDVIDDVRNRRAVYGVLPIENTTTGGVPQVYDLLIDAGLWIVGEEIERVDHCLLGLPGTSVGDLEEIRSHPHALAQCSRFLGGLRGCRAVAVDDTAGAALQLRSDPNPRYGAIAGEAAAAEYGLEVLQRDIADQPESFTRFIVVTAASRRPLSPAGNKISVVFGVPNARGRLARCLSVVADRGLNLTRIESRPRPGRPWEYQFYVDLEAETPAAPVDDALRALGESTTFLEVLGSYSAARSAPLANAVSAPPAENAVGAALAETTPAPRVPIPVRSGPYFLASREHRAEDARVSIGDVGIGGAPIVIAGPCSVESREQILACARAVREAGGAILRGGCFKPRTSPYAFQGLGLEALEWLCEAGEAFGLPVVTEVLAPEQVGPVAERADAVQIGARNMQNFELLRAVGRARRPVVLKRGLMSSIDEWLAAAEYVLCEGNDQVVLCERGIRTFEQATRNTLDLSAVQVVRERSPLPVIVDPSHACGVARWIPPMAAAALAAGAHGIMVEIHPEPAKALSDGEQSLDFDAFGAMMRALGAAAT